MPLHRDHDAFVKAIHAKQRVRVRFRTLGEGAERIRVCAPLDFGPRRRAEDASDCYHFWDFESPSKPHAMALTPPQIDGIEVLQESFDPASFVSWNLAKAPWTLARDWGSWS